MLKVFFSYKELCHGSLHLPARQPAVKRQAGDRGGPRKLKGLSEVRGFFRGAAGFKPQLGIN